MANIVIWPDIYRERGHWLPIINLAESLIAEGHTVKFIGIPDCEAVVGPYGLDYSIILAKEYPLGHSNNDEIEPIGQQWKSLHLMPIANGALDNIFAPTYGSTVPDLLISGYFSALENLLIHYKYNIPFVTTTTFLRHPQQDPAMNALSKLVYMPKAFAAKLMNTVLENSYETMEFEQFVEPIESFPEIIPCAEEFDCINDLSEHLENVTYVEPMISRTLEAGIPDPLVEYGIPLGKKLLFATCGSHVDVFLNGAKDFFKSLVELMSLNGMEEYHLLMTAGLDLFDNALRIEKYGLGKMVSAQTVSAFALRKAMTEVSTSYWIKKKVEKMYTIFNEYETAVPKPSIVEINKVLGI